MIEANTKYEKLSASWNSVEHLFLDIFRGVYSSLIRVTELHI